MRISTCMWGGMFNPIIPVFRTPPREWRREFQSEVTGFDIAKGYIEFFEPDAFVLAEPGLLEVAGLDGLQSDRVRMHERVVPLEALLKPQPNRDWSELLLGQTMVDALRDIYEKEQRFVLRDKPRSYVVSAERGSALTEALFGVYPTEKPARYFARWFEDVYKPEKLKAGPDAWRKIFSGSTTPLRATRYGIDLERSWDNDLVIFVFDPNRPTDLIDLWNMRLEPSPIIPIPVGWFPELADEVRKIIIAEHRPLQGNPYGVMHHATIEFSRSVSRHQADTLVELIRPGLPARNEAAKGPGPLVVKPWRNPVWERGDDEMMRAPTRMRLTVKERRSSLTVDEESGLRTSFETLSPDFAAQYGGHDLRWVNSVQLSAYGKHRVATVLPFNTLDRSWPRLAFAMEEVLIGTEGWSFGQRYKDSVQHIELMSQEEAMIGSLRKAGVEAVLSEPGHIAKQILEQLRGLWGVNLLADTETLKLLNTMAGGIRLRKGKKIKNDTDDEDETEELFDRRSKPVRTWTDLVSRRSSNYRQSMVTLEKFTERNIIRLGIETSCPHCRAANWHGIDIAGYELTCERCLKQYAFPQAELRKDNRNWAYRVVGPFSVPDYARGSYGALLAIHAISQLVTTTTPITFSTALSLTFDGVSREADFMAWHSKEAFDRVREPYLLIGESKSLGDGDLFDADDMSRMKDLGAKLPGSMLVFSVVRSDFTEAEKVLLRRIVRWGRRLDAGRGPTNRVLLLTSNEMFDVFSPLSSIWKDLGGKHAPFGDFRFTRNLQVIADSTVSIYLGLPSFEEERHVAWERRKQKRKDGKGALPPDAKIGRPLIIPPGS